jgi:hypothetical protein
VKTFFSRLFFSTLATVLALAFLLPSTPTLAAEAKLYPFAWKLDVSRTQDQLVRDIRRGTMRVPGPLLLETYNKEYPRKRAGSVSELAKLVQGMTVGNCPDTMTAYGATTVRDATAVGTLTRDDYPGEQCVFLGGQAVFSLLCENLIRPAEQTAEFVPVPVPVKPVVPSPTSRIRISDKTYWVQGCDPLIQAATFGLICSGAGAHVLKSEEGEIVGDVRTVRTVRSSYKGPGVH